jgi:ABC-2 type transport system ATP-binding protein
MNNDTFTKTNNLTYPSSLTAGNKIASSGDAIVVDHLRRVYRATVGVLRRNVKEVTAVDDISFSVGAGELFGLLGPNGAGKTTTVKVLTTLLIPTSGTARILDHDVLRNSNQVRQQIGFIFGGERGLYWRLSGADNLRYFGSLYHVDPAVVKKRIPYLLDLVGLEGRGNERVEGYSRGMKQRLHVARVLLHDPQVLFLDEPTLGLDPVGAREFRQVIRNLQSEKKTILLTTHYMFEADALCQRIAVINHGHIIALDTPGGLKGYVSDLSVIELEMFGAPAATIEKLRAMSFVDSVAVENHDQKQVLLVQTQRGAEAVPDLMTALNGTRVGKVLVREPTLEDAYVRLVEGNV